MEKSSGVIVVLLLFLQCSTLASPEELNSFSPWLRRSARCRLPEYPACYMVSVPCPRSCINGCLIDCALCRPVCRCSRPGAVCQDPRFVGGDGITFYFHGRRDRSFCLVSDQNLHINAHFIGKRSPTMKRDFTWVQSIAVLFGSHTFFLGAKKTSTWDSSSDRLALSFDGHPISIPNIEAASWTSAATPIISVTRTGATNSAKVKAEGLFEIMATVVPVTEEESRVHGYNVTNGEDCFAHLELGFKFHDLSEGVDGVLGQTYRMNYTSRVKIGAAMPVLGGDLEFSTSNIFATDCAVSRFASGRSGKMRRFGV